MFHDGMMRHGNALIEYLAESLKGVGEWLIKRDCSVAGQMYQPISFNLFGR